MKVFLSSILVSIAFFSPLSLFSKNLDPIERKEGAPAHRLAYTFNYPEDQPGGETLLTGIRRTKDVQRVVYITGNYVNPLQSVELGFLYKGKLNGNGKWYSFAYPSSPQSTVITTALYGPNNGTRDNEVQLVGHYTTAEHKKPLGCFYEGSLNGTGLWRTITPPFYPLVTQSTARSTMGGVIVGDYTHSEKNENAFLYDIASEIYCDFVKEGAIKISACGIWHNGGDSYTICGAYADATCPQFERAYLVDWSRSNKTFSHWRSYDFENASSSVFATHFNGIAEDGEGGYYLTGNAFLNEIALPKAFFCHIKKGEQAHWSPLEFKGKLIPSGNAIYKKIIIGSYGSIEGENLNGYISPPVKVPSRWVLPRWRKRPPASSGSSFYD